MMRRTFIKQKAQGRMQNAAFTFTALLPSAYWLLSLVIHAKNSIGVVFVTNLVDAFLAVLSHVKTIRTIDHNPGGCADVLIGMNNPLGDQDRLRIVLANDECHHFPVC